MVGPFIPSCLFLVFVFVALVVALVVGCFRSFICWFCVAFLLLLIVVVVVVVVVSAVNSGGG